MLFMTTWSVRPGTYKEAVAQFLKTGGVSPAGVRSVARYHSVDLQGGYHLVEADSAAALYEASAEWSHLLDLRVVPVVGDEVAGATLAKIFG